MISVISLALMASAHAVAFDQPPAPTVEPAPPALQDPAPPETGWTGSITLGGFYSTGNSDARSASSTADAEYRREKDRTTFNFLWLYSENRNTPNNEWELTDRKTSGKGKYDYFFSKKTYALAQASMESDWQANIDLRSTFGVGIGHQFVENEKYKFSAEVGVSEVIEDTDATFLPAGLESVSEYQALRGATTLDWNINKNWTLAHKLEAFESFDNSDDFLGHSDLALKAALTTNMLAQVQWLFDYDNTPAFGKERVDNRYLISIGWKF